MADSALHWNGNRLCAIDVETTGLDCNTHEIIQICVLPMTSTCEIDKKIIPFYTNIRLDNPEDVDIKAMKVNKINLINSQKTAPDSDTVRDLFDDWFHKLKIPPTKFGSPRKILPLGHNYSFDKGFLIKFFGMEDYYTYFDYHNRDTMAVAQYLNDRASFHAERCPFPKVNLAYVVSQLKIDYPIKHDALQDCVVTAEVYRRLCLQGFLG